MNKETSRHKQFIDQLEYYKLVYNNLLVKNNALLENNQELLSENNIVVNEQNLVRKSHKHYMYLQNNNKFLNIFSYILSVISVTKNTYVSGIPNNVGIKVQKINPYNLLLFVCS